MITSIYVILLAITGISHLALGVIVLSSQKKMVGFLYFLLAISISAWAFGASLWNADISQKTVQVTLLILYVAAIFIAYFYWFFTALFIAEFKNHDKRKIYRKFLTAFIPALVLIFLTLKGNFILKDIVITSADEKSIIFGKGYLLYVSYIILYFAAALLNLFSSYEKEKNNLFKIQLGYIIWPTLAGIIGGMATNLILPWFGEFRFFWLGPIFTIFMAVFITFAILKHHLMNVKIIATELFSGFLTIAIFTKLLLSKTASEVYINLFILLSVLIFVILLVKSVLKEVRTREEIEKLAKNLEEANKKLKKLDEEKSEFLSIASHQLRTPMTVIKGYISMIMEGSFGAVAGGLKEILNKVYVSNEKLVKIIGDLLDLSRIERGKMEYNFKSQSLEKVAAEIISELKPLTEQRGLKIIWQPAEKLSLVLFDEIYIRQVILNLIDNAIKYTGTGKIEIKIHEKEKNVIMSIKDSGMGIPKETMPYLFQRYSRGEKMYSKATEGMGLGLYVAKKIIDDHHGKIWAESEGVGKGATFFVELPISS